MKLPTFLQNKKVVLAIILYALTIVIVLVTVLIITLLRQDQEQSPSDSAEIIVSTDPASGEIVVTNTQKAPEVVSSPLYLGMDILYEKYNADFVRSILEIIEEYAVGQSIPLARVSMVAGSFSQSTTGSAIAQDLSTTTHFDIVLNIDQQELNVEIIMPFFGDIICTLRDTDEQIVFQSPVNTAN